VHAPRGADHAGAPQFFAGMSLSAAVLFDRALKQTRRNALREQGLVPRPLPQIRVARWLRAPRETYGAWSLMLLEGVRSLDEAVEEVREERQAKERARNQRREKRQLERARIKALRRHDRMFGRGRQRVELAVTQANQPVAAEPAALEAGQSSAAQRPAPPSPAEEPATSPKRSRGGANDLVADAFGSTSTSQTSPRLDTLEEKLARIERQFG
jgi:hypothetical protein